MTSDPAPIGIYIHVPVCRARCDYCDFFTRIGVAAERQLAYIRALARTWDAFAPSCTRANGRLASLYVGGGTPSALVPAARDELLALVSRIAAWGGSGRGPAHGHETPEVTVEVNPEDVTDALLDDLAAAGCTRLSLGLQSFSERTLTTLGRHVGLPATIAGVERVGARWGGRWSGDLIVAVPGSGTRERHTDIDRLVGYRPDHVSVYELTTEPRTRFGLAVRRGRIKPLGDDRRSAVLESVRERLVGHGYARYEVSNYALPGRESGHNLLYWRMQPHLGLGAGAVGTLPMPLAGQLLPALGLDAALLAGDAGIEPRRAASPRATARRTEPGAARALRLTGVADLARWIDAPSGAWELERLDSATVVRERIMMGLRLREGLRRRVGGAEAPDLVDLIPRTVEFWHRAGALIVDDARIRVTDSGLDRAEAIAVDAFEELDTVSAAEMGDAARFAFYPQS